ncbi:MAG: DUF4097 domain-containing protein [Firmicutes bacterium]|nr:DUF4097 domain-containing protein [Bacillota bacterium]
MKPTSIIFILLSLIIILVGWLVCSSAEAQATEDGIEIFDSAIDEDNNSVYTFEFGTEDVYNKIELIIDEADIYIYGGFAEPYMELVNFDEGSYMMTSSNRSISVSTSFDIMSIIEFWDSGFSFSGLRNYVRRGFSDEVVITKRINIYLPTDGDVNVINIELDEGSVYVMNLDTDIDITATLGDGNMVLDSVSTTSYISAEIANGSLYLSDVTTHTLSAILEKGDVNAENFSFTVINITGASSSVYISSACDLDFYDIYLSARGGEIKIDDEALGASYTSESGSSDSQVIITTSSGDIILDMSEGSSADDTTTEDETGTSEPETGGSSESE